jgi:hypothetical protein
LWFFLCIGPTTNISNRRVYKQLFVSIWLHFMLVCMYGVIKVKVKSSRYRPGVAQRVPGGVDSQIFSFTHRPPLPPEMLLVLIFTRGWVDPRAMVRSEGNIPLKNPMTPPGIDPGTVRLVAQHLNHYATPGPMYRVIGACKLLSLFSRIFVFWAPL